MQNGPGNGGIVPLPGRVQRITRPGAPGTVVGAAGGVQFEKLDFHLSVKKGFILFRPTSQ